MRKSSEGKLLKELKGLNELKEHFYTASQVRRKGLLEKVGEPEKTFQLDKSVVKLFDKKRVDKFETEEKNQLLLKTKFKPKRRKVEISTYDKTKNYYPKSDLLKRGWTEKLIRDFLVKPDATKMNPYFSTAARMKLYEENRVHSIEELEEFVQYIEKKFGMSLEERRVIAEARHFVKIEARERAMADYYTGEGMDYFYERKLELDADARMENLLKVKKWKPTIQETNLTYEELSRLAHESYEELPDFVKYTNGRYPTIQETEDEFFDRIILNYIRHQLTDYDNFISNLYRGNTVKLEINKRLYDEILKYFPFLNDACKRRLEYIS